MTVRRLVLGSIAVLCAAVPAIPAQAADVTPAEATGLGQQAYLYGFPLLETLRVRTTNTSVRCADGRGNAPVNRFSTAERFATPSDRTVVLPNVDTLYSIAQLDLGRGPVVLSHPSMGRRYFVFEFLDAYTNVVGYAGTRTTGTKAARFAITWTGHRGPRVRGARRIVSPTRRVWVVGRTLAGSRADQRRALKLMHRFALKPPGERAHRAVNCAHPGRPKQATTPTGLRFLDALSKALRQNPPPARDEPLLRRLATVGVGPGLRPARAGLSADALKALVAGVDATATALPGVAKRTVTDTAVAGQGWAIPRPIIGAYGTDYQYRAGVAELGLGANTQIESMYPTGLTDADGQTLEGTHAYRVTFAPGRLPPARAFWSLTIYDGDGFLVANPLGHYAIGSSHPGLVTRADGSIVVVFQRDKPSEAGVNWLPTPPGEFRLNLRLYWPQQSALTGAWRPPAIERVG